MNHCFEMAGFREMLRIKNYLKDMQGGAHDWVLLGMAIRPDPDSMPAGD